MDEQLKLYLDAAFAETHRKIESLAESTKHDIDSLAKSTRQDIGRLAQETKGDIERLAQETKQQMDLHARETQGRIDRFAEAMATEIGSLHTEIRQTEERIVARIEAIDARQRRDAGLTTTLMELVVKQTRWHEQSDNAVADLAARQADLERKLDELRRKAS